MSARSAHRLRCCPGAEAFAAAWDDALEIGLDRARDTAIEHATIGVPLPIVWAVWWSATTRAPAIAAP